jgi:hypothetical protein
MIQIDKDNLKEYINQKNLDRHVHVKEVIDYKIKTQKIYKLQISPESYDSFVLDNPELEKDGYVEITFIRATWNGWSVVTELTTTYKNKHLVGTFQYRENRQNIACSIGTYKIWLRDYKLNQILGNK